MEVVQVQVQGLGLELVHWLVDLLLVEVYGIGVVCERMLVKKTC